MPFDPESKGGSESTVKIAKADLVPTDANLLPAYRSFTDLAAACAAFCAQVNARVHRETGQRPDGRLAIERAHLHVLPAEPYTAALGETGAWLTTRRSASARSAITATVEPRPIGLPSAAWLPHELTGPASLPIGPMPTLRHRRTAAGDPDPSPEE